MCLFLQFWSSLQQELTQKISQPANFCRFAKFRNSVLQQCMVFSTVAGLFLVHCALFYLICILLLLLLFIIIYIIYKF